MPTRREILEQVAAGRMSPEEADRLLREAEPDAAAPTADAPSTLRTVRIEAGFGGVSVVGDESVAEVEIDGAHTARRDEDTLLIHADDAGGTAQIHMPGAFAIHLGGGGRRRHVRKVRVEQSPLQRSGALRVRMNPALALETKLDAGSLSVTGVRGPIHARLAAGPITIEGSRSALDVSVNAGAIRVAGRFTDGDSRIRSDAGAVRIELDSSSSVRILADAALGKIVLPGEEPDGPRRIGARREVTIGSGDATLRVETAMGSIKVTTP